jgi:hypothetical protein
MFRPLSLHSFVLLIAIALTACGGRATPQLIGSYPRSSDTSAFSSSEGAPMNTLVVYNAYLELEVANTDAAADRAGQVAYDYGGYLVSSQSWYQGDEKHATLTLAVPVARFDSAREALLRLGTLKSESVSGDLVSTGDGSNGWNTYSHITVQLRPTPPAISLPSIAPGWWNPVQTFRNAFDVFASIFTFLVDIVIWIVVVIGPFVLMGLGLRAIFRRYWKKS